MTQLGSTAAAMRMDEAPLMFDLSMNEVEMTAYKAARGAGLPWGLAEDAGRAARWLARAGFDWSTSLLSMLSAGAGEMTSPFALAAEVTDVLLATGGARPASNPPAIGHARVMQPLWAVPVIAHAAHGLHAVRIMIGADTMITDGDRVWATCSLTHMGSIPWAYVLVETITSQEPPLAHLWQPTATRSLIPEANYVALEALVYRTYVPTSEKSRLRGAGGRP
ncbi:DUF3726 domain-containing protein [Rhodoligotrophos ferricapiens]|uniref:DUF3726 domain-containing protein n=1 Tax=Rhodoligotrophos ferricapiens TaxID=3069264 RepID=UPI00315D47EE